MDYGAQWCSGKFGTVGKLGSSLSILSPSFLPPFSPLLSPTLIYLLAIISMIFLRINALHISAGLLGGTLLYHRSPLS